MSTKVIKLEQKHLVELNASGRINETDKIDPMMFDMLVNHGIGITLLDEDTILLCGGISRLWKGVGEAWTVITEDARKRPVLMHKTVLKELNKHLNTTEFHRVQCLVMVGFHEAESWAQSLGFMCEGMMHHYGSNKENFYRYAKVI